MGMASPMTNVFRSEPRKRSTTSMARSAPARAAFRTDATEFRMNVAWFWIVL